MANTATLNIRLPDTEKDKIIKDAINLGFVDKNGDANITAYIRFIAKNVKISVKLEKE